MRRVAERRDRDSKTFKFSEWWVWVVVSSPRGRRKTQKTHATKLSSNLSSPRESLDLFRGAGAEGISSFTPSAPCTHSTSLSLEKKKEKKLTLPLRPRNLQNPPRFPRQRPQLPILPPTQHLAPNPFQLLESLLRFLPRRWGEGYPNLREEDQGPQAEGGVVQRRGVGEG